MIYKYEVLIQILVGGNSLSLACFMLGDCPLMMKWKTTHSIHLTTVLVEIDRTATDISFEFTVHWELFKEKNSFPIVHFLIESLIKLRAVI